MKALVAQARFALYPALMVIALVMAIAGGAWIWIAGGMLLAVNLFGDEVTDEYFERVDRPNRNFLNAMLYAAPVLIAAMTVVMLFYTAAPETRAAGMAAALGFEASSDIAWWADAAGVVFTTGILTALATVAFGHELIHRTRRFDWQLGQLMCARCLHPSVALEHVYGHHLTVGTPVDASTAPRGMGFWHFLWRAYVWENKGAAAIEAKRLSRKGLPILSSGNRFLQGHAMLFALLVAVLVLAGWSGLAAFVVSGVLGLIVFNLGNYISHYGLVRAPGRPIEPRHSWNAPRFVSTSTLINIPRHSHHHKSAGTPYWGLEVLDNAPIHPHGWTIMSLAAMLPPLWFRLMRPCLDAWDANMASAEELALLRAATSPARPQKIRLAGEVR